MKLDIEQTNALERVHRAFTEFNDAARALKAKGFTVRIAKADKGAFFPFEIGAITYKADITKDDIKTAIEDRQKAQAPKPASTNGATQAQAPTGATNGVTDCDAQGATAKHSSLCEYAHCMEQKGKGMSTCNKHRFTQAVPKE